MSNESDNQKPSDEESLEVELPKHPTERSDLLEKQRQAIAKEVREHEARTRETARAIEENVPLAPPLSAVAWKSFLALGAVSAVYFLSLAFTDPTNFRDGRWILGQVVKQFVVTVAAWAFCMWAYKNSSIETQKKVTIAFLISCAVFLLLTVMVVLGLFSADGRAVWGNRTFVSSLLLQGFAFVLLFKVRGGFRYQLDHGDTEPVGARPIIYLCEGLMLYLALGIFLQVVFHIHVPMILAVVVHNPKALLLFCVPLGGYVWIRKLVAGS